MKTPFTPQFDRTSIPLVKIDSRSFVPLLSLPFIGPETTEYHVGGTCQVNCRWHDAFNVFVAVLEVVASGPLEIPIESHLCDLHLVYQLHGDSLFVPDDAKRKHAPTVHLPEGHRMEVYTPPARVLLQIRPDPGTNRFALAAVVPKRGWVIRHPAQGQSPMESLIQHLRQQYTEHRYLHPAPITPDMRVWLHLLLTMPRYPDMALDDALNGPMVKLVEAHRAEYLRALPEKQSTQIARTARLLVDELVARMDGSKPVTVDDVATAMHISRQELWEAYRTVHRIAISHYINEQLMEHAKAWLAEGKTVKEVGLALGYSTPNNFSRSFKKKYGISPDEYRNQAKSKFN